MLDAIKPLLDSDLVNEETRSAIAEQWEAKMNETRQQVTAELREEFAQRYEHDKSTMVEALDRMVTEGLTTELEQIAQERKAAVEDRAKAVAKLQEATGTFDTFLVKTLSEEIKELHSERAQQQELIGKLEKFVTSQLAEEISEFQKDRQDVVETKVRLVKEARANFDTLKEKFVKHTSKAVNEAVTDYLKGEMTQLKEDIQVAKENTFGRKIFETFATEFSASHLNENQKIKELEAAVAKATEEVAQINESLEEKAKLVESKEQEIAMIQEGVERKETLNTLLKPLNKDKAAIMTDLLESVQTSKLKTAFDRYLPAVLDGKSMIKESKESKKETITEVTGNKEQKTVQVQDDSNIVDIRKLAGLK
jgi:DNA repair exonuclease SbcCD ATPase subunit